MPMSTAYYLNSITGHTRHLRVTRLSFPHSAYSGLLAPYPGWNSTDCHPSTKKMISPLASENHQKRSTTRAMKGVPHYKDNSAQRNTIRQYDNNANQYNTQKNCSNTLLHSGKWGCTTGTISSQENATLMKTTHSTYNRLASSWPDYPMEINQVPKPLSEHP